MVSNLEEFEQLCYITQLDSGQSFKIINCKIPWHEKYYSSMLKLKEVLKIVYMFITVTKGSMNVQKVIWLGSLD